MLKQGVKGTNFDLFNEDHPDGCQLTVSSVQELQFFFQVKIYPDLLSLFSIGCSVLIQTTSRMSDLAVNAR